jgi:hypothetical protein
MCCVFCSSTDRCGEHAQLPRWHPTFSSESGLVNHHPSQPATTSETTPDKSSVSIPSARLMPSLSNVLLPSSTLILIGIEDGIMSDWSELDWTGPIDGKPEDREGCWERAGQSFR